MKPSPRHDRNLKERVDEAWGMSPRTMLQRLGTQGVRVSLGEDAWLKAFAAWRQRTGARRIVVPDVRFPNEAEFLDRLGAVFLVVRRPEASAVEPSHVSEHMAARLDGWGVGGGAVVTRDGMTAWPRPEAPRGVLTVSTWRPWPWTLEPAVLENTGTLVDLRVEIDRIARVLETRSRGDAAPAVSYAYAPNGSCTACDAVEGVCSYHLKPRDKDPRSTGQLQRAVAMHLTPLAECPACVSLEGDALCVDHAAEVASLLRAVRGRP